MLGTLSEKSKSTWQDHVTTLVHVYNCTKSHATDFSPYYAMFGRKSRIPLDSYFGNNAINMGSSRHTKYISIIREMVTMGIPKGPGI